jgi:hypothetical protein
MSQRPGMCLERTCAAPAPVVYDLLADLTSHLEWGGARQSSDFRLLSLVASDGPARAGSVFSARVPSRCLGDGGTTARP